MNVRAFVYIHRNCVYDSITSVDIIQSSVTCFLLCYDVVDNPNVTLRYHLHEIRSRRVNSLEPDSFYSYFIAKVFLIYSDI